jgi:hypothetical protein
MSRRAPQHLARCIGGSVSAISIILGPSGVIDDFDIVRGRGGEGRDQHEPSAARRIVFLRRLGAGSASEIAGTPLVRRSPALRASLALRFWSSTASNQHPKHHAQEQDDDVIHREPPSPPDDLRSTFPRRKPLFRLRIGVIAGRSGLRRAR